MGNAPAAAGAGAKGAASARATAGASRAGGADDSKGAAPSPAPASPAVTWAKGFSALADMTLSHAQRIVRDVQGIQGIGWSVDPRALAALLGAAPDTATARLLDAAAGLSGHGKVSLTDFLAACSALCIGDDKAKAQLLFSVFDMSGQHGIISFDEVVILLLTTTAVANRVAGVVAPLDPSGAEKLARSMFKQLGKQTTQGVAQSEFVYLVEELGLAARFHRPSAAPVAVADTAAAACAAGTSTAVVAQPAEPAASSN